MKTCWLPFWLIIKVAWFLNGTPWNYNDNKLTVPNAINKFMPASCRPWLFDFIMSMAYCKTAVTPLQTHWSYCSLALRLRCNMHFISCESQTILPFRCPQYSLSSSYLAVCQVGFASGRNNLLLALYVLFFFRGIINIYLHFVSFLHINKTQVVEIPHRVRQGPAYST